jgi:hypothetical protein
MPDYPDTSAIGPGDDVLTRDISSGRIHRRIRVGDNLASIEADNLDDAGEYEVITYEQFETAEPDQLCFRCFPPKSA